MSDFPLAMRHIEASNIPTDKKSAIRRFFEKATGGIVSTSAAVGHVSAVGSAIRFGGESLLIGGGLGYLNATDNLEVKWGNNKIPIDGVLAAGGLLGGVLLANHPLGIGPDLIHTGAQSLGILSFRKMDEWKRAHDGKTSAHGESSDSILDIAKDL